MRTQNRIGGKTKALKEALKGKKYIIIKTDNKTYEKTRKAEKKAYKELERNCICINECQEISKDKIAELMRELVEMTVKAVKLSARIEKEMPYGKKRTKDNKNDK